MANYPLWTHAETEKLRTLLLSGQHSWSSICAKFPNRTAKAVQQRARHIRCKNMHSVNQAERAAERKKARAYIPAPHKSNKPQLTADCMVKRATGELYHRNGRRVSYV